MSKFIFLEQKFVDAKEKKQILHLEQSRVLLTRLFLLILAPNMIVLCQLAYTHIKMQFFRLYLFYKL